MAERKTPTGMTKWEAGQVIIRASDTAFECAFELRETQPDFADTLFHMGCQLGTMLGKLDSHSFGLRNLQDCTCKACKKLTTAERLVGSKEK
jgi:hypothetical protein